MQNPLFFTAILPDIEIQREITAFKKECVRLFQASHALNSPPHITLQSPFRWPEEKFDGMKSTLQEFARRQDSFSIQLKGFGNFQSRVLFVDVLQNETLFDLKKNSDQYLFDKTGLQQKRRDQFHPHLTIAHRDLQESDFPAAWSHFSNKEYERQFRVNDVVILKHINKKWEVQECFDFG